MRWLSIFRGLTYSILLMISSVSLAEQLDNGKYKYCLLCHGSAGQGNSIIQAPAIAGVSEFYLRQQVANYRSTRRGDDYHSDPAAAEMAAAARTIADEEIAAIAGFLKSLEGQRSSHDGVEGNSVAGQASYMQACSSCHGSAAQGSELLKVPALNYLNDWYVVSSFNKYISGARGKSLQDASAQQMRAIVQGLPQDFSIEDIAAYIRSLNIGGSN